MQNKILKIFGLVVVVSVVYYCSTDNDNILDPENITFGNSLSVIYGDTLFNSEKNIWITFDSLYQDSRCPTGTVCVWEGNGEVGLKFSEGGIKHTIILNTHPSFRLDTIIDAYKIQLENLFPYPCVDSVYRLDQYSAKIIINHTD